jgi:hypothetical protein
MIFKPNVLLKIKNKKREIFKNKESWIILYKSKNKTKNWSFLNKRKNNNIFFLNQKGGEQSANHPKFIHKGREGKITNFIQTTIRKLEENKIVPSTLLSTKMLCWHHTFLSPP